MSFRAALCIAAIALVACSGHNGNSQAKRADSQQGSSAAPSLVVCGTELSRGVAGPVLYDASIHDVDIHQGSLGGRIYVRLSQDCKAKVDPKIVPAEAATIIKQAPAKGQVALVLAPRVPNFVIAFTRPTGPGHVNVALYP